jgi:hypothetical protein
LFNDRASEAVRLCRSAVLEQCRTLRMVKRMQLLFFVQPARYRGPPPCLPQRLAGESVLSQALFEQSH